ncbi:hypothetical protein [Hymenobacter latericus]|uniref:hypothetical protein n=1 Tax=Hymenobacter sp. YIM 151858-1 TaxID=2987688 RepID=UPI002225DB7B|nr:hypothetical protein [Hymenobacter sp. YIM 151858-1]UYZ60544.1 hypothetical protein OIS50_07020 [Hymenobacter sp. YIM 151858-1]
MANVSKVRESGVLVEEFALGPEAGQAAGSGAEATHTLQRTPEAALPADAVDASLCPLCAEPLGWHETPCFSTQPESAPDPDEGPTASPTFYYPPATIFAFNLGQAVQAAYNKRAHRIIWRGQVKERHPATGLVHRVNVYRLNDGYWDCYREDDLQVA